MNQPENVRYTVNQWIVEPYLLAISKEKTRVTLEPRVMDLLVYLCEHPGKVLTREDLVHNVWHSIVTDNAVSRAIAILRKALGDSKTTPKYIVTIPTIGYRFIADVSKEAVDIEIQAGQEKETAEGDTGAMPPRHDTGKRVNSKWLYLTGAALLVSVALFTLHRVTQQTPGGKGFSLGPAIPLTTLIGNENDPSFSPSGDKMAFAHRAVESSSWDIYIKEMFTGNVTRITDNEADDRSPDWSPDSQSLLFHRLGDGRCAIMKYDFSDARETELVSCNPSSISSDVAWSSDPNIIYFTDGESSSSPYKIYQYSIRTGRKTQLTNPRNLGRGDYRIDLSPDGRELLFIRNLHLASSEIHLLNLARQDSSKIHQLTRVLFDLSWDAEGRSLIFIGDDGQIATYNLNTGQIFNTLTSSAEEIHTPVASPDGRYLAVVSGSSFQADIWVLDLESRTAAEGSGLPSNFVVADSQPRPLIQSSRLDNIPRVAFDDANVAFVSNRSGLNQIWLRSQDGQEKQLTNFEHLVNFVHLGWSRDSNFLSYAVNGSIYQLDIHSRKIRHIPSDLGFVANPVWSESMETIFLGSEVETDWQIWTLNPATGETSKLTSNGGFVVEESADGKGIYYSKYRAKGIWYQSFGDQEEILIVPDYIPSGNYYDWYVRGDEIFYSTPVDPEIPGLGTQIVRLNLITELSDVIYTSPQPAWFDFSVSSSGQQLFFTKTLKNESTIIAYPILTGD